MSDAYLSRRTRTLLWGVFLILLGSAFMLERLGALHFGAWKLWPLVPAFFGLQMIASRRPGEGVMFLLFAAWFFAVEFHFYGLTYHNSWPLALVAVGTSTVIEALTRTGGSRVRPGGES